MADNFNSLAYLHFSILCGDCRPYRVFDFCEFAVASERIQHTNLFVSRCLLAG